MSYSARDAELASRIRDTYSKPRPGKFEGEATYVPFYWEMGLEGRADEDDGSTFKFRLDKDDYALWPELKGRKVLKLRESEQGFVYEV